MTIQPITVKTMMDTKVFTDFSHFNSFRLNKRWLSLVPFPVIIRNTGAAPSIVFGISAKCSAVC